MMRVLIVSSEMGFMQSASQLVEAKGGKYRIATGENTTRIVLREDPYITLVIIDCRGGIGASAGETIRVAVSTLAQRDGGEVFVVVGEMGEASVFPEEDSRSKAIFVTTVMDSQLLKALGA